MSYSKYVNTFANQADYEAYIAAGDYSTPNIAYIADSSVVKIIQSGDDVEVDSQGQTISYKDIFAQVISRDANTVTIPDTVTKIGSYAFYGYSELESVTYKGNTYVQPYISSQLANAGVTLEDNAFDSWVFFDIENTSSHDITLTIGDTTETISANTSVTKKVANQSLHWSVDSEEDVQMSAFYTYANGSMTSEEAVPTKGMANTYSGNSTMRYGIKIEDYEAPAVDVESVLYTFPKVSEMTEEEQANLTADTTNWEYRNSRSYRSYNSQQPAAKLVANNVEMTSYGPTLWSYATNIEIGQSSSNGQPGGVKFGSSSNTSELYIPAVNGQKIQVWLSSNSKTVSSPVGFTVQGTTDDGVHTTEKGLPTSYSGSMSNNYDNAVDKFTFTAVESLMVEYNGQYYVKITNLDGDGIGSTFQIYAVCC